MMAFHRFPFEVWEHILERLDKSQDVLNVFMAYPELQKEGVLNKTKHLWLFDPVIPHILPWLRSHELLFLRQVCMMWSHGVDHFLENHPAKRAYDPKVTGQIWIPRACRAHHNFTRHFSGLKRFCRAEQFRKFCQDMDPRQEWPTRFPSRNPFIGSSIVICDQPPPPKEPVRLWRPQLSEKRSYAEILADLDAFWEAGLEFLEQFGSYIKFLQLEKQVMEPMRFHRLLFYILQRLPNLKSLKLDLSFPNGMTGGGGEGSLPLPSLPRLETLDCSRNSMNADHIIHPLVLRYSNQIRRLSLDHKHWRGEYSRIFPKLTELILTEVNSEKEVARLIQNLEAPELHGLQLIFHDRYFFKGIGRENILQWTKTFPRVQDFVVHGHFQRAVDEMSPPAPPSSAEGDVIPSLKSFKLLSYGGALPERMRLIFLLCFPYLEYLAISGCSQRRRDKTLPDFWKMLPHLKEVNPT